ncbi:MAG: MFS transporter [Leptospiraceae bacterium]|nr:MFS transporter [Leptospiraceae bacterium]
MLPTKIKEWQLLLLLACIQFSNILDFVIMMPLSPRLMDVFKISPAEFGFLVSSYAFSAGISGILGAFFLDRFDRRIALNTCYAGLTVATLICGVVHTYPLLMAARIMAGAFGGLTGAIIFAIVGDLIPYDRRGKATGIIMSAFSLASVIGVPVGLWLAEIFNWNAPFFALFGFSAVTLVFAHFYTPSVKGHLSSFAKHPLKTLETLFLNKNHLTAFALITMMMFGGFSVIPFIAPYLVANVGITNTELSYLYILGGGFTVFTARIIGSLADKFGKPLIFAIIAIISILPILALTNLPKVPLYITLSVTTCFFVFVSGRFTPAMAMITASVHPLNRGSFMSMVSSVQQIASGLAASLSGVIIQKTADGQLAEFPTVGIVASISTIVAILISTRLKTVSSE